MKKEAALTEGQALHEESLGGSNLCFLCNLFIEVVKTKLRNMQKELPMFQHNRSSRVFLFVLALVFCQNSIAEQFQLMLAKSWNNSIDPTGWWMSEKFDGMRGYWNGKQMLTRTGKPVSLPVDWYSLLPDFTLDGELWLGRGKFAETMAIVGDRKPGPGWADITYLVFDAPSISGTFEQRLAKIDQWLSEKQPRQIRLVEQIRCQNHAHLQRFVDRIEEKDGEGAMLRAAGSLYQAGRSPDLLKVKRFDDTEAKVIAYNPGKGKYHGLTGSLRMQLPNGIQFSLGSGLSDAERRSPPPIGSIVTFKHHGWTSGSKPRFPVFWRVRQICEKHEVGVGSCRK